jgi:hypothetical protein
VLRFTRVVVIKLARKHKLRKQTDTRGRKTMNLADIVQRGWEAVGAGDFDSLVSDYVEDMKFIARRWIVLARFSRQALKSPLFKFEGDKIYEERWFLDTDQWKSAF